MTADMESVEEKELPKVKIIYYFGGDPDIYGGGGVGVREDVGLWVGGWCGVVCVVGMRRPPRARRGRWSAGSEVDKRQREDRSIPKDEK